MALMRDSRPTITAALLCGSLALGGCSGFQTPALSVTGAVPASATNETGAAAGIAIGADTVPIELDDDLALGKRHFAEANYGKAEQHFRRAVEKATGATPRDAEAWLGLAAAYDRLRRFDHADRAYSQALRTIGPTAEVLNNQGYSFLLRRDYRRARLALTRAIEKDSSNVVIRNNLALLDEKEGVGAKAR